MWNLPFPFTFKLYDLKYENYTDSDHQLVTQHNSDKAIQVPDAYDAMTDDMDYNNRELNKHLKLTYGHFDTTNLQHDVQTHYTMDETTTSERKVQVPTYCRWTNVGYLGQFDGKTLGWDYNYIWAQLDNFGFRRNEHIADPLGGGYPYQAEEMAKHIEQHLAQMPIFHIYYFKGKIVLVPTWTPYDLYEPNTYGPKYQQQFDHYEVGRTRPIDKYESRVERVRIGSVMFDVFIPYLANDRSLHSYQGLEKKVYPVYEYTVKENDSVE